MRIVVQRSLIIEGVAVEINPPGSDILSFFNITMSETNENVALLLF